MRAECNPTYQGCVAKFSLEGDTTALRIPRLQAEIAHGQRKDGLWRTTCFEIFWQTEGHIGYHEFNLSPSTDWAAYSFGGYRGDPAPKPAVINTVSGEDRNSMMLVSEIESELMLPARIGLACVLQYNDGTTQHWALQHREERPDFHASETRILELDRL